MFDKKNLLLVLSLVFILSSFAIYFYTQLQPVSSMPASSTRFVVDKGQSVQSIAQKLQQAGLIKNSLIFSLLVKQQGLEKKLQAGSFKISPEMTPLAIAQALTEGTNDLWITIPEGWRREQIATYLANQEELLVFDQTNFLSLTANHAGRLFPDTYLVARESTAKTIFNLLNRTFQQKVVVGLEKEIGQAQLDLNQILTLASIVEREARGATEMKQVAGILSNRLEIGMALQADATLQYAKANQRQALSRTLIEDWWPIPLAADKKINSAFNTYAQSDLPPSPICNPGLNAIKATLNPTKNNYLYYLHDTNGEIHYAHSLEEHNANVRRYLR